MMHLLLGNIEPGTTDEEILEFIEKYGFPPFDEIVRLEGDGSRPAVALTFHGVDASAASSLQPRLHQVFWKGRQISATVGRERFV